MAESLFAVNVGVGILGKLAIVIASLGCVYLIHELGHLLAGKACGMKIWKYYFGFDNAADPRSFAAKAVWQRIFVIAAGSLMNLVFAAVCAAVAYRLGVSYLPCILGGIAAGEPAWEAGLRPGAEPEWPIRSELDGALFGGGPVSMVGAQAIVRDWAIHQHRGGRFYAAHSDSAAAAPCRLR